MCVAGIAAACGTYGHAADWPALGRDFTRNAVSQESKPPTDFDIQSGRNIRWSATLQGMAFGAPVIADGLVWIGDTTGPDRSFGAGKRYIGAPTTLKCLDERTGELLYELECPRVTDWFADPDWQGLSSSPLVEGDRLWFVTTRSEVICLDISPLKQTPREPPAIVWRVDLYATTGVRPRQPFMGPGRCCSIAPAYGDLLFVTTCNGVAEPGRFNGVEAPAAPSLVCFDKRNGEIRWQKPTGEFTLYAELASPLVAEIQDRAQVIVPHGDGWVRSYVPESGELLWEFDINPKQSSYGLGDVSSRNFFLAAPVLYEDRIYIGSGRDLEGGVHPARLVCIDPGKMGDISSELVVRADGSPAQRRRLRAIVESEQERTIANPNSGLVWDFAAENEEFVNQFHGTRDSVAIKDGLLIVAGSEGTIRCLDAVTGERMWQFDTYSNSCSQPLIVDDKVFVIADFEVVVLTLSSKPEVAMPDGRPVATIGLRSASYAVSAPVFANGTLYLTCRRQLIAIGD
jgi:outer membrane protein assembly factor BamB